MLYLECVRRPLITVCLFILLNAIAVSSTYAGVRNYVRDYTYVATKYDSKYTSRLYAIDGVKRSLLNEIGTYVQSVIRIYRDSLGKVNMSHDMENLTAGIIKLKILKESWKDRQYYVKASMQADDQEVFRAVKALQKDTQLQDTLRTSLRQLNDARTKIKVLKAQLASNSGNKLELLKKYNQAAQSYEAEMQFQEAVRHIIDGDFTAAKPIMESLATQGNPAAQERLGFMYERGLAVKRDYHEAAKWFSEAAKNGKAKAYAMLGDMYVRHLGVAQDYGQALIYYHMSAKLGSGFGYGRIGYLYQIGQGVERNDSKAVNYYKKAAALGDGWSTAQLGMMYHKGRGGLDVDNDKAFSLWQKAAAKGNPSALALIGNAYLHGISVSQDYEKAFSYLQKAYERGASLAYGKLGFMYEKGLYVNKDLSKAIELYRQGARFESSFAEFRLGNAYQHGIGVDQNKQKARKWYRLAANKGSRSASRRLVSMGNDN